MVAPTRLTSVQWMLLAALALMPTAVFAQQDPNQPVAAPAKPEAAQGQTEAAQGQTEAAQAKTDKDAKEISGMSILGNQDAPKSLVIVPWKSSELGQSIGISTLLDDSRLPIDKEVFMRMLSYYEIRSETVRPTGAPTEKNAAQPPAAAQRRK
jgi:hypothetical protein